MGYAQSVPEIRRRRQPGSVLHRCGGVSCAPGTCDHDDKRLSRTATGAALEIAPPQVQAVLDSGGSPLEPVLRADMERRLGHDFGAVRIHADTRRVGQRGYQWGAKPAGPRA